MAITTFDNTGTSFDDTSTPFDGGTVTVTVAGTISLSMQFPHAQQCDAHFVSTRSSAPQFAQVQPQCPGFSRR